MIFNALHIVLINVLVKPPDCRLDVSKFPHRWILFFLRQTSACRGRHTAGVQGKVGSS